MKLKFKKKPKKKPVKLSFFKPVAYHPKRSKRDWKLIDRNPFGDKDGDRVPNIFDCKPYNKKKQGKFSQNIPISKAKYITMYHGTSEEGAKHIMKTGIKPQRFFDEGEKTYVSPQIGIAKEFAEMRGEMDSADLDDEEHVSKGSVLKINIPIEKIGNVSSAIKTIKNMEKEHILRDAISNENISIVKPKIIYRKELKEDYNLNKEEYEEAPEILQSLKDELREDL